MRDSSFWARVKVLQLIRKLSENKFNDEGLWLKKNFPGIFFNEVALGY